MGESVLGVIGGSGLYDIEGLEGVRERAVETPYGAPSDPIVEGRLGDAKVLFLPRHGRGHVHPPHLVNYRANICALKKLGATHLVSISAVGSMREHIEPGHVVVVDQFIDLTKRRISTFFDEGLVAHVGFSDPVCPLLASAALEAAKRAGATVHAGGTYVCMEGPQFSTRAESNLYRSWGVDVIGMTAMPEAKLAREAELPYATVALATDYDCWHSTEEVVTVDAVIAVLKKNVALAKRLVRELLGSLPDPATSPATGALASAVITDPSRIDPEARARLDWLIPSNPNR
ncbi:MAG TPA: S-methyl-5'-thioadenosine phosphorylase [Polyangiaceae bacterium]|jgi:5'-methylthioadenosine phosphorylase|nr:S-methyl-5'-thioadenosine phosphorylase [Polyangiaceae bacterium]